MTKRRSRMRGPEPTPAGGTAPQADAGQWVRRAGLAVAVGLLTATPVVPSEAAAELGSSVLLLMGWLLLLAAWFGTALLRPRSTVRFCAVDAALLLFLGLHTLSAVIMAGHGHARPTINVLWQWLGFGIAGFLFRQLLRSAAEIRAVLAVMLSLAVCLSAFGLYQYAFGMQTLREEYQRDPERALRRAGVDITPGSPERKLFEDRLQSTEPTATFALTNSLAGFLVPWLLAALGIGMAVCRTGSNGGPTNDPVGQPAPGRRPKGAGTAEEVVSATVATGGGRARWAVCAAAAAWGAAGVIGFCLLLTKSRTAFLAAGLGALAVGRGALAVGRAGRSQSALPLGPESTRSGSKPPVGNGGRARWRGGRRLGWKIPVIVAAVVSAMIGGVIAAGAFDWLVVSETPKSVLYRLQYWRSTLALIADHPWLGCGPGNFQQYYPAYKLPEASETIADPHNFLLEVWATAGSAALVAWLALLWLWCVRVVRGRMADRPPAADREPAPGVAPDTVDSGPPLWIYVGGLVGVPTAFPCAAVAGMWPDYHLLVVGWPLMALSLAGLYPWVVRGGLPAGVPLVAAGALLLNLLAAGGIGFPGVAQNWWLLWAVALNLLPAQTDVRTLPRACAGGLVLGVVLLLVAYRQTMYQPVLERTMRVAEAERELERGQVVRAEETLRAAATADPYSADPWVQLALLYQRQAVSGRTSAEVTGWLQRFDQAVERVLRLDRRSPPEFRQVGDWRLNLFRGLGDPRQLELAIAAYTRWAELYPNSNLAHAQLAWVLHLAGREQAAADEAAAALRLDAACPHTEKQLQQQRVYDPVREPPRDQNAEQLMRQLRKATE